MNIQFNELDQPQVAVYFDSIAEQRHFRDSLHYFGCEYLQAGCDDGQWPTARLGYAAGWSNCKLYTLPTRPRPLRWLILGLVIGLVVGCTIGFL